MYNTARFKTVVIVTNLQRSVVDGPVDDHQVAVFVRDDGRCSHTVLVHQRNLAERLARV